LIETFKTATDQGRIARSADMGPNGDSTTRSVITWIPSSVPYSSMTASTAECIAVTTPLVPIANGITSFPIGPSAAVQMHGGFPVRCGISLPVVPTPPSCDEIVMPVDAPIVMPERTEYVDEAFKYDVKTASHVPEENPVKAPIRPRSKLGGPAQRQIAQERCSVQRRVKKKTKYIKLSLTFGGKDQRSANPEEEKKAILTRFEKFNLTIERFQNPDEESQADYVLTFPNPKMAQDAFNNQDKLRYKLKKWWFPRPSPKNPKYFEITSPVGVTVRTGKSFEQPKAEVPFLPHGTIVVANQSKGRRCRICKEVEVNGERSYEIIGWVSIHTTNEPIATLIRPLDEVREFPSYCENHKVRHKNDFQLE